MQKISDQTIGHYDGVWSWLLGFSGLARVVGGILLLALLHNPGQALSVTLPGYSVALAWNGSPSPEVTGYRIYLGTASGVYSSSVAVGNVTTLTIPGLASGVTYFLAITAHDANGQESDFSNEIIYTTPTGFPIVQIGVTANQQAVVTIGGLIGHRYDIEATQDFTIWTVIGTVTLGASGSVNFTDPNTASLPLRFYRTHDTQP